MAFDSVFNGDPRTAGVSSSGKATNGIDISTGQTYFKDDAIGGWQPVAGGVLVNTTTLTNAQLVASSGGAPPFPVLIPAPGAGKIINPISFFVEWKSVHALNVGAGSFEVSLLAANNTLWLYLTYANAGFLDQATSQILSSSASTGGAPGFQGYPLGSGTSSLTNTPLVFAMEDTVSGGSVSNSLTITTYYTVITVV